MTILHVSGVQSWGGGENHLEVLYHELEELNLNIKQYIICVKGGDFHNRLKNTNYRILTASLKIKVDTRYIFKIISSCIKYNIDVIHIHDPDALALCVIADKICGKLPPFIYAKKTSFPIKNRKSTLFKYNYKKIKKIICVSKAVEKVAMNSIEDKSKLTTIYDGIRFDNKEIATSPIFKEKYKIHNEKIIVGTIGNHIRAKNLLTFIDVINEIVHVKGMTNFHFIQIGSFTERTPMYLDKVKDLKLESYVTFTNFLNNASHFIPQFDIFLLTSQSEGLPQVINEAFYFKRPVVSTNVGGIPEIIKDKENGFLANVNDFKKLAHDIITLSQDKALYNRFIQKSFAQLTESFSSKIMAKKTLEVYRFLLKIS
jgi:glycosyltransferase involved in cell wall biosynthesis